MAFIFTRILTSVELSEIDGFIPITCLYKYLSISYLSVASL